MMQAAPLSQVPLGGSGALTAALDAAAGEVHDGGRSDSLVQAVEREYLQLHTATGRPTGALRLAQEALADAQRAAGDAEQAVAEAARDVDRHAVLSAELAALDAERSGAARAVAELTARWDDVERLRVRADEARRAAVDARREHERALDDRDARSALVADEARRAESAELLAGHDRRRAGLEVAVVVAAAAAEAAQAAADRVHDLAELGRLERRLQRLDDLTRRVQDAERAVADARVDGPRLRAVESAAGALDLALARQSGAAARLSIEALAGVRVVVDDGPVDLAPGERADVAVAEPVEVLVPEVLRVRVLPGAAGDDLGAGVRDARRALQEALAAAGASNPAGARRLHEQRRQADSELSLLRRQLSEELGPDDVQVLRRSAAALGERALGERTLGDPALGERTLGESALAERALGERTRPDDEPVAEQPEAVDGGALREAARAAQHAASAARADLDAADAARAGCREQLTSQQVELARSQAALNAARSELDDVRARLATARAALADDELAARVGRCAARAAAAAGEEEALLRALREADADSLRPLLDNARAVVNRLEADLGTRQQELAGVVARLEVVGGLGRQQLLDDARTALSAAEREAARLAGRARAAALLRDTLLRHREDSRRQYVEPYREQVTRLGRIVFGADFAVDVDNELRIVNRTREGTTVPFDALSSGAKEQLGIIARLACAAIVHEQDGVPVLVDDALGYSDPERLRRVGAVLAVAASSAQVIVLTCTPERYRSVGSAHVISLDGAGGGCRAERDGDRGDAQRAG
jgi:hypothetical protein